MCGVILLTVPLTVLGGVVSEDITVGAGENAKISCMMDEESGVKYFARSPCTIENALIRSDRLSHSDPRYSLVDHGSGKFTVTISNVKSTDYGWYCCGGGELMHLEVIDSSPSRCLLFCQVSQIGFPPPTP